MMRRFAFIRSCSCVAAVRILAVMIALVPASAEAQGSNPIVLENQQPGAAGWDLDKDHVGTDAVGQIKGYASAVSINKGQTITFRVSVNPAQTYTIDVFRIGWYGGMGGSSMTTGQTSTIYTGQLVVDMYDSTNHTLVWRGVASKTLDPKAKPEKQEKNLNKAVAKLFKNYPPKAKT